MTRYYIVKDGTLQASTATREQAIDLIHQYQAEETHPFLRSEFFIICGEQEHIPYPTTKKSTRRTK